MKLKYMIPISLKNIPYLGIIVKTAIILSTLLIFFAHVGGAYDSVFIEENKTLMIKQTVSHATLFTIQVIDTGNRICTGAFTCKEEDFNITSYIATDYTFSESDVNFGWKQYLGSKNISKYDFYWWNNSVWKPLNNLNGKVIKSGKSYIIKVIFYKEAETGISAIKTIPSFVGTSEERMTWYNTSKTNATHSKLINPYNTIINVTLHNGTGMNNLTDYFGWFNNNMTGWNVTKDNVTEIPAWKEFNYTEDPNTAILYINISSILNASDDIGIYHGEGNLGYQVGDASNGNATFPQFHDKTTGDFLMDLKLTAASPFTLEYKATRATSQPLYIGVSNLIGYSTSRRSVWLDIEANGNVDTSSRDSLGYISNVATSIWNSGTPYRGRIIVGSSAKFYSNNRTTLADTISTNIPTENMGLNYYSFGINTSIWYFGFIIPYTATPPTFTGWGTTESQPPANIPPTPIINSVTTGNFFVNTTWIAGSGVGTDSYNVSSNGTWNHNTTLNYVNSSVNPHGWSNITVFAHNSTYGNESTNALTMDTQIPNNPISISGILPVYDVQPSSLLTIDANYSDLDGDTGIFSDDATEWNINPNTGVVSWAPNSTDIGLHTWNISVTDNNGSSSTYQFNVNVNLLNLTYPINGSTLYKSYPPQTTPVNFTWGSNPQYNSNLLISKDINFNIIQTDITTGNNYSIQNLEGGFYWWKVRNYDSTSGSFLGWSNVSNFTIINNNTISGTGIQGTVYALVGSIQSPLSGATVYISNNTWSSQQTVGSNGYYLFNDLALNSLYYLRASKSDYQTTDLVIVNVTGMITKDIPMKPTEPSYFEPDKMYVNFFVHSIPCSISICEVSNAIFSVYEYGNSIATVSGVTDSSGFIRLYLLKTKYYRITVVNSTAGINYETFKYINYPDIEIIIGSLSPVIPNANMTPSINTTHYQQVNVSNGSISSLNASNLNSSIGLGVLGQGILVGIINWVVVGAGGILTTICVSAILVYLGVLSVKVVVLFVLTGMSILIITRT